MSLLLPILTTLIVLLSGGSAASPDDIQHWCRLTPHPNSCLRYTPHLPHPTTPATFFDLSVSAALRRALQAEAHLRLQRSKCNRNPSLAQAWSDCALLYNHTILHLNRSLTAATAADKQTWLSAALTNLDTCSDVFSEEFARPLQAYNVTDLISNSLAVNANMGGFQPAAAAEDWAEKGLRRLLQAEAELVVAKDGSGDYGTVGEAIREAEGKRKVGSSKGRLVIRVKGGVYEEYLQIGSGLVNLTLVGDGKGVTIITGNRSTATGFTTFSSPTVSIFGDGFIAQDLTFRNTYGPTPQAPALLVASDHSIIHRCSIEGYQDTLCVFSQRQFYRKCDIYGTIDFIFGNAAAALQECNIIARLPLLGQSVAITAQGRNDPNQNTGIVIQKCVISSGQDLWPVNRTVRTYLGRPWMKYSRTIYMQSQLGSLIHPSGWLEWDGNFALDTLYYAEFNNTGPGSNTSKRVSWKGYHIIVKPSLVRNFTVANFLAGGLWIQAAGVPFTSGL
ncbi:Pectinesterase 2 [Acorus gramineus]|uniref:Pectinesterase n=1 Tax=Acorus gramineus TaxID=55184 RepID=A0AAV9B8G4_ACOGR|nr:Pectinesterase 2 [Acorus gramineus]